MRMILFGATGGTGQALLTQALAYGHHVTAVVRRPDTVHTQHPQLTLVPGDVLHAESFATSMADQDVVLSALGVRNSRTPTTLYSAGTGSMLAAMQQHGVRRLLCITSSGVPRDPGMPWWYRRLVKPLIQPTYDDMARMEALVHASATAWTIVRPGYLTNGTRTAQYRVRIDTAPPGGCRHRARRCCRLHAETGRCCRLPPYRSEAHVLTGGARAQAQRSSLRTSLCAARAS